MKLSVNTYSYLMYFDAQFAEWASRMSMTPEIPFPLNTDMMKYFWSFGEKPEKSNGHTVIETKMMQSFFFGFLFENRTPKPGYEALFAPILFEALYTIWVKVDPAILTELVPEDWPDYLKTDGSRRTFAEYTNEVVQGTDGNTYILCCHYPTYVNEVEKSRLPNNTQDDFWLWIDRFATVDSNFDYSKVFDSSYVDQLRPIVEPEI